MSSDMKGITPVSSHQFCVNRHFELGTVEPGLIDND